MVKKQQWCACAFHQPPKLSYAIISSRPTECWPSIQVYGPRTYPRFFWFFYGLAGCRLGLQREEPSHCE